MVNAQTQIYLYSGLNKAYYFSSLKGPLTLDFLSISRITTLKKKQIKNRQ